MRSSWLPLLLVALLSVPVLAADDPMAAYEAFRKALTSASSVKDLRPYLTRENAAELDGIPADKEAGLLFLMKSMMPAQYRLKDKQVKGGEAVLHLVVPGDPKTTGTIRMKKEDGAWKLDKEDWNTKMN
ncbi:MAG: hypothetical protein HY319_03695 [Armatimonadetes bacterium]|nr:hypothetical protein [Armatimonadota bacterium]